MIQRIGWVVGLLFLVWGVAFAQRTWEGTATVARYGEFPPSGMYGASNSFERNSIVDVENLSNGKRARIIITGRVSDPTQFLVVSEQVAAELGIGKFDVARVRVSPVVTPGIDPSLVKPELPLSPDPDINPSARVSKASESPASGPPSSSETPRTPPVASTSPVAPSPPRGPATSEPSATSPAPAVPEPSRVETPTVTPKVPAVTPSEGTWKEPDVANPYAGLEASLAKRDKSAFAGLSMVLEAEPKEGGAEAPSPVSPAIPPLAPSPTPSPAAEGAGAEAPKVAELPMEAVKPESKETGPLAGPPASEGETQTELQIALEPTGPKPPEGGGKEKFKEEKAPSATAEVADAASKLSFPIQEPSALQRGFYYLQLGMFAKPRSAQSLWERFHRDYPLVVLKEEVGLRVLVGPLQGDERGVLYQTFKALGLKDAFFVKID